MLCRNGVALRRRMRKFGVKKDTLGKDRQEQIDRERLGIGCHFWLVRHLDISHYFLLLCSHGARRPGRHGLMKASHKLEFWLADWWLIIAADVELCSVTCESYGPKTVSNYYTGHITNQYYRWRWMTDSLDHDEPRVRVRAMDWFIDHHSARHATVNLSITPSISCSDTA